MRDIEDTIKAGERNRDTMVLVRNFCAHVRVEKFGGTGLIEQMTGLPIGHHGLQCDHAPDGGLASWDLRDSVVEFYDLNCANCAHRKALRLPNMMEIVGERDRKKAARDAQVENESRLAAQALEKRNSIRSRLLPALGPVARTLLEDIGGFDADRSTENFERVTQSARLAPEHFTPALVQYVFDLAGSQPWFANAALVILDAVDADDEMIVKLAVSILMRGYPDDVAVAKLQPRLGAVSEDLIASILPSAIDLADPDDRDFLYGDGDRRVAGNPDFLYAIHSRFPAAVIAAIEEMLLSGRRSALERAGRGIHALHLKDTQAAATILRTLTSVYVRAPSLVTDMKDDEDRLPDLAKALNGAFASMPEDADALLQELNEGAPTSQRARILKVYAFAMQVGYAEPAVPASSKRHALALNRLVWAPTIERDDKVLEEVISAFRSGSKGLEHVIRDQLDAFIGALFLLDDRLTELDEAMKVPAETTLVAMERNNRRAGMRGLMEALVEWASEGAVGDEPSVTKLIAMFETIPEGRDNLRGALLGATKELSSDLAGLKQLLPHLYAALVGASVIGRSYAATAVGELPYRSLENVPDLLFEAFGALLWDQYILVHKTAVQAFRRSILPESYRRDAAQAILNLIRYYRVQPHEDQFLSICIGLLAGMADMFGEQSGAIRRYLIDVAMDVEPIFLQSDILSLSHTLGTEPEFARLAARMVPHLTHRYNRSDKALNLLSRISAQGLKANSQAFHDAAIAVLDTDMQTALGVVEAFLATGMTAQAERLVRELVDSYGDSVRLRQRRTLVQWPLLAIQFEAAVAAGDVDAIKAAGKAWTQAAAADALDKEDAVERRARSNLPF